MNNASLELGGTNWAEKDASLLGYTVSDDSGRFFPQEFTFSRGSNLAATRIGKTGLIEKGRENLLVQSNQFDTTWAKSNTSVTSGHSGYDGSSDAWKLIQNTTNTFHYIYQNVSATSICTYSIYAKAGEYSGISFFFPNVGGTSSATTFNLLTGTFVNNTHNATSEDVGGGWYRISLLSKPSGTQGFNTYVNQTTQRSEAGDGTSGIYIQDAQLELGLAASPYIPTTTTTAQAGVLENTPRLNYTTGVANPSLLLEPSRTQLISSEYFGGYTFTNSSIETNDATSPEGLINAAFLKEDTSTGIHLINQNTTASAGVYTASVFVKANGRDWLAMNIAASANYSAFFNLSNGTTGTIQSNITSATIEAVGTNGWYRCSITADTTTPAISPRAAIYLATGDNGFSYTGNGTDGVLIYGFQLEQGSYPTSYIPNHSGGSVTRGSETCGKTGVSSLIGQTEGTIFFEWSKDVLNFGSDYSYFQVGSYPSYVGIYIQASKCVCEVVNAGAVQATITKNSVSIGTHKAAVAYANNDISFYFDGVQVGTDSLATIPATSQVYLNSNNGIAEKIKQALIFKERLTNAELITLTTI